MKVVGSIYANIKFRDVSLFWGLTNLRWEFRRKSEQKGNHASDYKPFEHSEYHWFCLPLRYISEMWFANQNIPCRGQLGTVSEEEDIPSIVVHHEKKLCWLHNLQWKLWHELLSLERSSEESWQKLTGKKHC